jgi:DNA-binding CsgD family transcriptional regulator
VLLGKPLLDALDRMRCGGIVLDKRGDVLLLNSYAEHILKGGLDLSSDDQRWARGAIKSLLQRAESRFKLENDSWVMMPSTGVRPLVLHAVQIAGSLDEGPHTVLILIDLSETPQPRADALKKMFGLTEAEIKLARAIARGEAPDDIAKAHGVKVGTVRAQLASVFAKTGTTRQAELVALLARVSIIP